MRAAKDVGGRMWQDADDVSWSLLMATNTALTVISWFENLPKDEQPPRHIWWSEELVDSWFREVRERREAKYGGSGTSREDSDMMRNELVNRDG